MAANTVTWTLALTHRCFVSFLLPCDPHRLTPLSSRAPCLLRSAKTAHSPHCGPQLNALQSASPAFVTPQLLSPYLSSLCRSPAFNSSLSGGWRSAGLSLPRDALPGRPDKAASLPQPLLGLLFSV